MIRAGIDLDGVCYRWGPTANYLLNSRFGYDLKMATSWNYIRDNVSPEHYNWLWTRAITEHGIYRHGNAYKGTFEGLKLLQDAGHEIIIITSRPRIARADTLDWLAYHRIPAREVHIIGDEGEKLADKSSVPCDYYVDDSPSIVRRLEDKNKLVLLWDQPWNRDCQSGLRVNSWQGVLNAVREKKVVGRYEWRTI